MDDGKPVRVWDNVSRIVGFWRTATVFAPYLLAAVLVAAILYLLWPRPPAPQVGRFQLGGVPGHAYVIDTATGQVWEHYAAPNEGRDDEEFRSPKLK